MQKFDTIVIGGGPGGYPAAIKAAQLGKKVALIESGQLGGTCLNRGCIPSKALIACSDVWKEVNDSNIFGIEVKGATFDYEQMASRKDAIVAKMLKGLEGLIQANKITVFKGFGKMVSPNEVKVLGEDNAQLLAEKIIIATGSEPRNMSSFPFDEKKIHSSTSLLQIKQLPKKIAMIGGGVIGCEFASLFHALGVEVVILELLPRILPMEDVTVSKALTNSFTKRGIEIHTQVLVEGIDTENKGIKVLLKDNSPIDAEIALVSVGRSLNTSSIGLDKAGVLVDDHGLITVNEKMQTNIENIFAVGDIASTYWLAHVATHQGIIAAKNACGEEAKMSYNAIPSVIFTDPEIGTVGMTLDQAKEAGFQAVVGAFPFQALGKSQSTNHPEGFAQVVIDKKTGQILGSQVVGHEAATLISEMTVAIANELTIECISETIHGHPTLSEAWHEAALLALGTPLHLPPRLKRAAQVGG